MSQLNDLLNLNLSESTERSIAEYIWIGGSRMDLRSKARTLPRRITDPNRLPTWNSSTGQAPGEGHITGGNMVPPACCDGIKSLYGAAKTTLDHQSVCSCLKSLVGSYKTINFGKATGLPGKCGVSIPYKIAPSTDCSK